MVAVSRRRPSAASGGGRQSAFHVARREDGTNIHYFFHVEQAQDASVGVVGMEGIVDGGL
jgi:hypothetical protein